MIRVTSHVIDVTSGLPAASVSAELGCRRRDDWYPVATTLTGDDGRLSISLAARCPDDTDMYRLVLHTGAYFVGSSIRPAHPVVTIVFWAAANSRQHLPVSISPAGYWTYRGS